MKKLISIFLLLTVGLFAQSAVKTSINYHEVDVIFNGVMDTVEYSNAISLRGREGIMTLFLDIDTTGAATTTSNVLDSCVTIGYQLYEKDIGWCADYSERTTFKTITFTKIDTIARNLISGENLFMDVASEADAWAIGDSMRFVFFGGVGATITDTANVRLELRQE